ncbi:hypothetical protein EJB05_30751, partial [Eragrostis curvula]
MLLPRRQPTIITCASCRAAAPVTRLCLDAHLHLPPGAAVAEPYGFGAAAAAAVIRWRRGHPWVGGVPPHGGRRREPFAFSSPTLIRFVKMPGRDQFYRLHDDIVASILVRLLPKQIARARLVCRRWRAITTDHHFVRASFSRPHAGHGHPITGFFYTSRFMVGSSYLALDRESEVGPSITPTYPASGTTTFSVASSCSGLLLLVRWLPNCQEVYYVCNPLTRQTVPIGELGVGCLCLNLAFDMIKSRHFKVVALGNTHSVYVYSPETRTWRMAIHSDHSASLFHGLCPTRGIFWNGSVVWIVAHSLVRFSIEEEHVTKMPMPLRKKDWICAYIGESGGHLQMIGYTKKEKLTACFDVLEMQEHQSEWSILFRVDLSRVKELYPNIEWPTWDTRYHQQKIMDYLALSPIYVIRGIGKTGQHALIFSTPGKIMSYKMMDREISVIKEIGNPFQLQLEQFWYSFYAYNPSLFAL